MRPCKALQVRYFCAFGTNFCFSKNQSSQPCTAHSCFSLAATQCRLKLWIKIENLLAISDKKHKFGIETKLKITFFDKLSFVKYFRELNCKYLDFKSKFVF